MSEREAIVDAFAEQIRRGKDRGGFIALSHGLADSIIDMLRAPVDPPEREPTAAMVRGFADAVIEKLRAADRKYGHGLMWRDDPNFDGMRREMREHMEKGDPRDVAAYCAFLWYHDETTISPCPNPRCESWGGCKNPIHQEFRRYRRTAIAEMADWEPGVDLSGVSVSEADTKAGSPKPGDKIARNPKNHDDRWLVAADYFAENFEPFVDPPERVSEASALRVALERIAKPLPEPYEGYRPSAHTQQLQAIARRALEDTKGEADHA